MNVLDLALNIGIGAVALAFALCAWRLLTGPETTDRILADPISPSGLIFHVSRCGSTLTAKAIARSVAFGELGGVSGRQYLRRRGDAGWTSGMGCRGWCAAFAAQGAQHRQHRL